jgi:hypothetical protein
MADMWMRLCLDLLEADEEDAVVQLLDEAGFWDRQEVWRYYGDYENNFNTIGNQQSSPEAALVEKIVNSIDARLMNECMIRGIDPEGEDAPRNIEEAVALVFGERGRILHWTPAMRAEQARFITLAATGRPASEDADPSFSIADAGEGQTPDRLPDTILSLNRANKLRIPFVQGKFNMGGTGVLKFCGRRNLQFVLSRRNPELIGISNPSDLQWGFTIVRREDPIGNRRSSVYTYLAPIGADRSPQKGGVLRFSADCLPIFPDGREAYVRESPWGTLIKLYEYSVPGSRGHILRKDGILSRIDLLLADIALPIRLHECRAAYKGHPGSFDTTLTGLAVRLEEDRGENMEEGFPSSIQMTVGGENLRATLYAFKKGKGETYKRNEGVIFTINGQTHGHLTVDFFKRKSVRLGYLVDSILVVVDCSALSGRAREDLFMNSRDRLSKCELREQIEGELERLLRQHEGLRALSERRRREEIQAQIADSRPLEEVLQGLIKRSPTLAGFFLPGKRLPNPFKPRNTGLGEKPFTGQRYPSFFKIRGLDYGEKLYRSAEVKSRSRFQFDTDATNDYFSRIRDPGTLTVELNQTIVDRSVSLHDGLATVSLQLPSWCKVGDNVTVQVLVTDPTRAEPFLNTIVLKIVQESTGKRSTGSRSEKRRGSGNRPGAPLPTGIELPKVIPVREEGWASVPGRSFDKFSAVRIVASGDSTEGNGGQPIYDYYVNLDNICLNQELKTNAHIDPQLLRARFTYGMVLCAMALIQDEAQRSVGPREPDHSTAAIENVVEQTTRALGPILLPMISALGDLGEESIGLDVYGEAV